MTADKERSDRQERFTISMGSSLGLLDLPPEIRDLILVHLFDTPRLVYLKCPSRCRLRQSRVDKDDPSGALYTCRLLRQEAIPPFLAVNTLRFRHSADILDFLADTKIDARLRQNITRVAVDDGDIMDLQAITWAQVNAIAEAFTNMPRLRCLEFRGWARTDNAHYLSNLNKLSDLWSLMKQARTAEPGSDTPDNTAYSDFVAKGNHYNLAMSALQTAAVHVSTHDSREKYATESPSRLTQPDDVNLQVCTLLLSKNAAEPRLLGGAEDAVAQRMKVAGATHIKDDNVLERLSWSASEWPWIDLSNPRALGERYH